MSEMLQPGTHRVKVTNVSFSVREGSSYPQLTIRFEDEMGEGITWYHALGYKKDGTWSADSFKFAQDQIRGLNVLIDSETDFVALGQPDISPLMGAMCDIVVVNEVFEGKTHTKVKFINDPNRVPGGERMEAPAALAWQAQLRDKLRVAGFAGQPKAAPPRRAAAVPAVVKPKEPGEDIDFDSIPF